MEDTKKYQHFHMKIENDDFLELKRLSENHNLPMGQYLVASGLHHGQSNTLYTKQVHSFMLHLENFQKILEKQEDTNSEIGKLRSELYQEAKELWQSLNM